MKFLAIKNWRKYQNEDFWDQPAKYVMDWCDKDADLDRTKLSVYVAGVLDRLLRLRGRTGRILYNDITWLIQATHIPRRDAAHMAHAIHTLTERNFIIPTNDENFEVSNRHRKEEENREEQIEIRERGEVAPRSGASPQDQEKDKPYGASDRKTNQNQHRKPCACADGLCDWSEPISGCDHPASVGDAVYYQRHVRKNDYFIPKLTKGYVLSQWKRLLTETPEDYTYDPDPMYKERTIHLDGGETKVIREIHRRPKTAKERAQLQNEPVRNAKWLFDPACAHGCREGSVDVPTYPGDPQFGKLTSSEICECVVREESTEAEA